MHRHLLSLAALLAFALPSAAEAQESDIELRVETRLSPEVALVHLSAVGPRGEPIRGAVVRLRGHSGGQTLTRGIVTLDEDGAATVALPLPRSTGRPGRAAGMTLEADLADGQRRHAESSARLTLSTSPWRVESRWLHPRVAGETNRLAISVQTWDGAPANVTVTVRRRSRTVASADTGPNGIATLEVPIPREVSEPREFLEPVYTDYALIVRQGDLEEPRTLDIRGTDAPTAVIHEPLVLAGDPVEVEIRGARAGVPVDLAVVVGHTVVAHQRVTPESPRATASLPLPPVSGGIGAVVVHEAGKASYTPLTVIGERPLDVRLTAAPREPSWSTDVGLEVRDADGGPVGADAALFQVGPEGDPMRDPELQESVAWWLARQPLTSGVTWVVPDAPAPPPRPSAPSWAADLYRGLAEAPGPAPDRGFDALVWVGSLSLAALLLLLALLRRREDEGWPQRAATAACAAGLLILPLLLSVGGGLRLPSVSPGDLEAQMEADLESMDTATQNLSEPRRFPGLPHDLLPEDVILPAHDALAPNTGVVVAAGAGALTVNGRQALELDGCVVPPAPGRPDTSILIPTLYDATAKGLRREAIYGERSPARGVTLVLDRTCPADTLVKVMYTTAQAGFTHFRLVRRSAWTPVVPPAFGPHRHPLLFGLALLLVVGGLALQRARWPAWVAMAAAALYAALLVGHRLAPVDAGFGQPLPSEAAATALWPWVLGAVAAALIWEAAVARRAPPSSLAALAPLVALLALPVSRDYRAWLQPRDAHVILPPVVKSAFPPHERRTTSPRRSERGEARPRRSVRHQQVIHTDRDRATALTLPIGGDASWRAAALVRTPDGRAGVATTSAHAPIRRPPAATSPSARVERLVDTVEADRSPISSDALSVFDLLQEHAPAPAVHVHHAAAWYTRPRPTIWAQALRLPDPDALKSLQLDPDDIDSPGLDAILADPDNEDEGAAP